MNSNPSASQKSNTVDLLGNSKWFKFIHSSKFSFFASFSALATMYYVILYHDFGPNQEKTIVGPVLYFNLVFLLFSLIISHYSFVLGTLEK